MGLGHHKYMKSFPKSFLWGASTSAHQVEGGNINDWSEWEKENAERLARGSGDYWEDWQQEKFPEMFDENNYISGDASDHYNRYEEDIALMKELNMTAYRFSIEWSRIEPSEGEFNNDAINHYKNVIKSLKKNGIEPFVTLWHWTIPLWLRDKGGINAKNIERYFSKYTEVMVNAFRDDVKYWITINEPLIYSGNGYLKGVWPPGKKNIAKYLSAFQNLVNMHRESYKVIKGISPSAEVGIAKHNIYFEAYGDKLFNRFLKRVADWWWNYRFLNLIEDTSDFIGLNHYFHNIVNNGFNKNENIKESDLGWELYPKGIYYVLLGLKKYNKPIYIAENGLADADDENRYWYLKESLINVHKAIEKGVDVRGYMHWSLLDNFEWDKGFWPRFGLIKVDYSDNLKRNIRKSARGYATIIESNGLK